LFAVLLLSAESAEELFKRASAALQMQNYAAAEAGFQAVLKQEPRNIGALGNLGVIYSHTQRYTQAISIYRAALKIVPNEKTLLTNLGLAYIKQEQYAEALPIFEKLAKDASNLQAHELLAMCDLSLAKYSQAVSLLIPLQQAEPENAGVFYMSGVAYTRLKQKEEAHQAYIKMMNAVTPAQANFLMGKASYETGDFEQAAEYFRKTLQIDSSFDGVHRELGKTLVSLHQDEAAIEELRKAQPNDAEALYFLGAALSQSKPAEAIPLLNRAKELTPDFWGPWYYLGRIALDQSRTKQAIPFLEQAAKLKPRETAIHYQLAKAFQQSGHSAEAQAEFARVKQLKGQALQKEVDILSVGPSQKNH
jgi:tetratricopeptide (TPR) repeat protein